MFVRIILRDGWKLRNRWSEDGAAHCWALARKVVLGLSLTLVCQSALAQAMYRIKPLTWPSDCGGVITSGFNEADQVIGYMVCNSSSEPHAFLWKNDGAPVVDLGPSTAGAWSRAVGLNNSGQVAGQVYGSVATLYGFISSGDGTPMRRLKNAFGAGLNDEASAINDLGEVTGNATMSDSTIHAVVWKNDGTQMVDLGSLGGDNSRGSAINSAGQVAGTSTVPSYPPITHAFLWRNDGTRMQDIGALGAHNTFVVGINVRGQIAGNSDLDPVSLGSHAFFWRNDGTPMQDLSTLGGGWSTATALNDRGQVTGYSTKHGANVQLAFVWMNNGAPIKSLGALGGTRSSGNDINSSGMVIGSATLAGNRTQHAFLWRNDGTKMQDLNTLIDPNDPLKSRVSLNFGAFINDHGDIVAAGGDSSTGGSNYFLLQGTVILLSPRSLAFGNQPIGATSAVKSVTVTNTSAKVVAITSIKLAGTNANQFTSTNNCGSSLVGKGSCTISVRFKPTTKGAKSATLSVNGGGGGLRVVNLTGTGT